MSILKDACYNIVLFIGVGLAKLNQMKCSCVCLLLCHGIFCLSEVTQELFHLYLLTLTSPSLNPILGAENSQKLARNTCENSVYFDLSCQILAGNRLLKKSSRATPSEKLEIRSYLFFAKIWLFFAPSCNVCNCDFVYVIDICSYSCKCGYLSNWTWFYFSL